MKKNILLILLLLLVVGIVAAQTSSLVYTGQDGKLIYEKYANQGEDTLVNVIPDFSFAGYMQGGISLPDNVPVRITLEPSGSEDDKTMIQNAIDLVSSLIPDENGYRGTILFKKGIYKVNGSLTISASGVVLKGEGQLPVSQGGTELVATAPVAHSFIKIEGNVISAPADELELGLELVSFDYPEADHWIISEVITGVENELNVDSVITFILYSVDSGNFKIHSKENGDSTKIPFVKIVTFSEALSVYDTLKIYPTDDTYVRGVEEFRDTIYGHDNLVFYKKLEPDVARIGFLKFDLSSISGTLISAELHMMASREDQSGQNFLAYSEDDNWSENTRTWNNTFGNINTTQRIVTNYVGTGATSFEIEDASTFNVGEVINVRRTPNQLWCDTLGMSRLSSIDPAATDWTPDSYTIEHERRITAIQNNTIYIDIPIVDPMQHLYGGGEIQKKTESTPVENCGIENMYITSVYKSEIDEEHGWDAILITDVKNCWVQNVTARYFGYSCVNLNKNASYCTVQDCALLDPKSLTEGGRKYPFPISGGIGNLVQRCYARGGRHSFATHSRLTGPHVFLDCYAIDTYADIGPHHRWAAGVLYDNIYGGQIRVQNRLVMGSGHGWAGVQNMFWNCHSYKEDFKIESPLGGRNWGIGCVAQSKEGNGFWESYGTPVLPRSLYLQQLEDRLGEQAVFNITTEEQRIGNIWDKLADWEGSYPTAIFDINNPVSDINVYPNPTTDELYIDLTAWKDENVKVQLCDTNGKCFYIENTKGGMVFRIDLPESIKNELVLLRLNSDNISVTRKIVVK